MTDAEVVNPVVASSVAANREGGLTEARKPREAALALELLAEGQTYDQVSEATGLGFGAISALKARHQQALDIRRLQLAGDGFQMAEQARLLAMKKMEMLADDEDALKKTPIKDLVMSYAISVDKGFQALGEQKTIIEHRAGKPSLADAVAAIEEARRSINKQTLEIEVEEIKNETT